MQRFLNVYFDQDHINQLTDYILNDKKLAMLANVENWEELYRELAGKNIAQGGFLYQYFQFLSVNTLEFIKDGRIEDGFFLHLQIKSIEIPENITEIGMFAFIRSAFTSISLPDSVVKLDEGAFYSCEDLQSIKLSEKLEIIGESSFEDCHALEFIEMFSNVKIIGIEAFKMCENLKSIKYHGSKAQWRAIKKHSHWNQYTNNYTVYCDDGEIKKA